MRASRILVGFTPEKAWAVFETSKRQGGVDTMPHNPFVEKQKSYGTLYLYILGSIGRSVDVL